MNSEQLVAAFQKFCDDNNIPAKLEYDWDSGCQLVIETGLVEVNDELVALASVYA